MESAESAEASQSEGEKVLATFAKKGEALYLQKNIAVTANAESIVNAALERFGSLHILVNNANASKQAPIMETTSRDVGPFFRHRYVCNFQSYACWLYHASLG